MYMEHLSKDEGLSGKGGKKARNDKIAIFFSTWTTSYSKIHQIRIDFASSQELLVVNFICSRELNLKFYLRVKRISNYLNPTASIKASFRLVTCYSCFFAVAGQKKC